MFLFEVLILTMQGRYRSFLVTHTISSIYSLSMFISWNMTKTIHIGMTIWWIEPSTSSVPMDLCFSSGPFVQHRLKQKSNPQAVCRVETISVFGDSTYSTSLVYVVRHTWIWWYDNMCKFQILSIYMYVHLYIMTLPALPDVTCDIERLILSKVGFAGIRWE